MSIAGRNAIALIDCDSFYASCEQMVTPSLKGKAICVMSNNDGCIVARSKEAKELGIKMGMPVFQAKKAYPEVYFISGNLDLYGEVSSRVMTILKNYSPTVEIYSIDEAFIDLTGLRRVYRKNYIEMAEEIKTQVYKKVGIPVSAGVSLTKVLAKIATERAKKSQGYYMIGFRDITRELKTTQLIDVWGIGNNTTSLLNKYNIYTAYQYTQQHDNWIKKVLGKTGLELKYELTGESVYPVNDKTELPKSIQKTSSFAKFTSNKDYILSSLHYHTHRACKKLRKLNIKTKKIGVMLRTKDFKVLYGSRALLYPTNWEFEIFNIVNEIFEEIYIPAVIFRSSGVGMENFSETNNSQLSLFEDFNKLEEKEALGTTWDNLEEKYGRNIITAGPHKGRTDLHFKHTSSIKST